MSLTKRYLESLPQAEQDAILGPIGEEWEAAEVNDLNDVPSLAMISRGRPSISCATRIVGSYAFFPGLGWRRYWTLADATWNQYMF